MDRRNLIFGGMAGAAGLALTAMPAEARRGRKADSGQIDRSLKGPLLDLTTPIGNREAFARIMGNTVNRPAILTLVLG